jgi:hypothetical protein
MKRWLIVLLLFVISELLGSLCAWHGTPTDWSGPPLRFWHYEFWRLMYWAFLASGAACSYFLMGVRRFSVQLPVALATALAVELITSVSYWRALNIEEASFLGWPSEFYYIREHLFGWAIVPVVSAVAWLIWLRRKSGGIPIGSR